VFAVILWSFSSNGLGTEVRVDFHDEKSVRADLWLVFVFFDVFLVALVLISKLSSTKSETWCWTSSVSWIGVGAVISPCTIDCGLRRVFNGSNGDVGDLRSDWARSLDRLRRRRLRRLLDFGRNEESKKID